MLTTWSRHFSTHGGNEKYIHNFFGKPEGKRVLGRPGADGRIILKLILIKCGGRINTGFF
jgi:hypothetical protein